MLSLISIRVKIFLSFLLLVGVISLLFALSSYYRITTTMNSAAQKHGADLIKIFSQLAAPYIFESDYLTVTDIATQLTEDGDVKFITITDAKGKVWISTKDQIEDYPITDQFYSSVFKNKTITYRGINQEGEDSIEFIGPISAIGQVTYLVISEISLEGIKEVAVKRIQETVYIAIFMILLSSLIAFYLARLLTKPIEKLMHGTDELAQGNLSHRINITSSDEIGVLSTSFNSMAGQLEKESSNRKYAENKLREHSDNLEKMVQERTVELRQANQLLSVKIAERNVTARELKKSEERYKRLSEVTTEGIVLHNNDRIIDCNSTFEKFFNYTLDEIQGENLLDSIFPPDQQETIRRIFIHGGSSCETMGKRKDGTLFPVHLQSMNVNPAIDDVWVTSIRDITEQRKLEKLVHQTQRLESIGLIAGGVAHDLNNILSGIVGYPDLILNTLDEDSKLRAPIEAIQESGKRAATVVADLLTIARGAASIREIHSINILLQEYLDSPEFKKLQALHPRVTCEYQHSAAHPYIHCSPVHVKKCFMNLVTNATEAIAEQGVVVVSTENKYVDDNMAAKHSMISGEYVVLKVQDNGPGIADNDLEHIFEPFYTKKVMGKSGSGLGLTVVWNTMEDHDGKIILESSDQGTCFQLYFPVIQKTEIESTDDDIKGNPTGNGEHVLIVDDEPQLRDIGSQILESQGYKVDSVSSGELAIKFIQDNKVDLLVIDMLMEPGMNGRQTYQKVTKLYPDQKALIVSGFSESDDVKATLKLGAGGFIKKPYSMDQLVRAVREVLNN